MTRHKVQLIGIVLIAYLVATYLSYSTYIQGDFSIYFQAGERIREGMSIYSSEGNLYVYGPLLANILSPLTIFGQLVISRFWLISSILSTLTASWLFYRAYLTKFGLNSFIALISILSLSFSLRNNLGNGNVMAFVLLSLVIAIRLAANSYSLKSSLTLSLVTIFVFEVKTYIAIFLIAFLFLQRKYLALGLSFFLALLLNLLYFFRSGSSYLEWVDALKIRATGVHSGSDQATILVFANRFIPGPVILSSLVALAGYALISFTLFRRLARSVPTKINFSLMFFSVAPILTIFSHGQDYILSTFVLSIFLIQRTLNKVKNPLSEKAIPIALGLLINWTNQSLTQVLLISAFYLIILRYLLNIDLFSMLYSFLVLALSTTINAYLLSLGGDIQYLAYNFQALVFGICVFSFLAPSELDNMSNNLNE